MYIQQEIYRRRLIHEQYGGQQQGGISTPKSIPAIFLFTGDQGKVYGYKDSWTPDGLFNLTGEGQRGDMEFVRGNRAIRDHAKDGKDLYLFQYVSSGYVRFIGQVVCTGYHKITTPDLDRNVRNAIVFELTPIQKFNNIDDIKDFEFESVLINDSMASLRLKAIEDGASGKTASARQLMVRYRSAAVRIYALKRADGICESCNSPAPFNSIGNIPFLEVHHIRRLSDGGPDHPLYVIAVCPNCHRKAHHYEYKKEFNDELLKVVEIKENIRKY